MRSDQLRAEVFNALEDHEAQTGITPNPETLLLNTLIEEYLLYNGYLTLWACFGQIGTKFGVVERLGELSWHMSSVCPIHRLAPAYRCTQPSQLQQTPFLVLSLSAVAGHSAASSSGLPSTSSTDEANDLRTISTGVCQQQILAHHLRFVETALVRHLHLQCLDFFSCTKSATHNGFRWSELVWLLWWWCIRRELCLALGKRNNVCCLMMRQVWTNSWMHKYARRCFVCLYCRFPKCISY